MTPLFDAIGSRLAQAPLPLPQDHRHAAVALILRELRCPEVLLMQRAVRPGDRWSGQVSLPGGHRDAGDADLAATAARETHEEVGLDLARDGSLLGHLEPVQARARGTNLPLTVAPIVFGQLRERPLALGDEAEHAFWLPLDRAAAGELDSEYRYEHGEVELTLPCWRFEGSVVWGMTLGILGDLLGRIRAEL